MIDWHHPRIYERLRCFGFCLFTLGVASHNVDNPPAALAAIVVTVLLIVRLKIELDIKRDEEEHSLERTVQSIRQINTMASVPAFVGLVALVGKLRAGRSPRLFSIGVDEGEIRANASFRSDNIVVQ